MLIQYSRLTNRMAELEELYQIDIQKIFNQLQQKAETDEEVLIGMESHLYSKIPRPIRESLMQEIQYYLKDIF